MKKTTLQIWIAEDNTLYRNSIVSLINNSRGMKSTDFANCEDLLRNMTSSSYPDVCLLDIGLPGMNGIECARRIKTIQPKVQIIMITVFDDSERIFDAICAGASGYLLKASNEKTILQSIKDVLEGGSPMNPSIARKVITAFAQLRNPKDEFSLTEREKEILSLLSKGLTKKELSQTLFLSVHTVDSHIRNIYHKLHVHTRAEAIAKKLP